MHAGFLKNLYKLYAAIRVDSLRDLLGNAINIGGYLAFWPSSHVPVRSTALGVTSSGETNYELERERIVVFQGLEWK